VGSDQRTSTFNRRDKILSRTIIDLNPNWNAVSKANALGERSPNKRYYITNRTDLEQAFDDLKTDAQEIHDDLDESHDAIENEALQEQWDERFGAQLEAFDELAGFDFDDLDNVSEEPDQPESATDDPQKLDVYSEWMQAVLQEMMDKWAEAWES